MIKYNNLNSTTYGQLKECYELAVRFENNDKAKDVIREKIKRLEDQEDNIIQEYADTFYSKHEMEILSEIICVLASEDFMSSHNSDITFYHKINSVPDSAEKEFVLALLSLRSGTNETQRLEAVRHLSAALNNSPDDPRFIALFTVLQEAQK